MVFRSLRLAWSSRASSGAWLLIALAPAASAQTVRMLLKAGDEVFPYGNVLTIPRVAVNDKGEWTAEVRTTAASTIEDVVVRNEIPILAMGRFMSAQPNE